MKRNDVLWVLSGIYDEVYKLYQEADSSWNDAVIRGGFAEAKCITSKKEAYLKVMEMIMAKWKEA